MVHVINFITKYKDIFSLSFELLMVVAGFSAIVIYKIQERDKIKTAATLILEQIDEIENIIRNFNDIYTHDSGKVINDDAMYLAKEIPCHGAWEQYQHLMLRKLAQNEIMLINDFFESARRIEKARADAVYSFKAGWESKSLTTYMFLMKILDPTYIIPENAVDEENKVLKDKNDLIAQFYKDTRLTLSFKPDIAYRLLYAELESFSKLNGTTAYSKLYKLSYRNKR